MVVTTSPVAQFCEDDYDCSSLSSFGSSCANSKLGKKISDTTIPQKVFDEDAVSPRVYENLSIIESSDIHIGDKTIYQGPVTIKQFLYPSEVSLAKPISNKFFDNYGFSTGDKTEKLDKEQNKFKINTEKSSDGLKNCQKEINLPNTCKDSQWLKNVGKQKYFSIIICLVTLLSIVCIILLLIFYLKTGQEETNSNVTDTDEQDNPKALNYDSDLLMDTQPKSKLRIVNRVDWLAQPPIKNATVLITPVPFVVIHHTATENCFSHAQCILQVRRVQQFHIESRGWWDIGYNFLVGADGAAYEGRGWKSEGAHSLGFNSRSIGIAFIGTFMTIKPPDIEIIACKKLIDRGVELGYIAKDYKLFAARQLHSTESPGKVLYETIKSWKHWSSHA